MERRSRRFNRYRYRRGGFVSEPYIRYQSVESITPDLTILNLRCITVTASKLISESSARHPGRLWEVLIGDDTGQVLLHLDEKCTNIAEALKPNVSITLRNGYVKMIGRKYVCVAPGNWGRVDVTPMMHPFKVKTDVNVSTYEYTYVPDTS